MLFVECGAKGVIKLTNSQRQITTQDETDQKLGFPRHDDGESVVIRLFEQRVHLLQTGRILS